MAQAKIMSLTLKTIDHQGRLLDPPQVTAEVTLIIEVRIPYAVMSEPALTVQEYIRSLGPQFSTVDVQDPDEMIVRA